MPITDILENNAKLVGKTLRVLCDSESDDEGMFVGRDSGFKLVKFKSENSCSWQKSTISSKSFWVKENSARPWNSPVLILP